MTYKGYKIERAGPPFWGYRVLRPNNSIMLVGGTQTVPQAKKMVLHDKACMALLADTTKEERAAICVQFGRPAKGIARLSTRELIIAHRTLGATRKRLARAELEAERGS